MISAIAVRRVRDRIGPVQWRVANVRSIGNKKGRDTCGRAVGQTSVQFVSGGERKRVSNGEMMATRGRVQSWDTWAGDRVRSSPTPYHRIPHTILEETGLGNVAILD